MVNEAETECRFHIQLPSIALFLKVLSIDSVFRADPTLLHTMLVCSLSLLPPHLQGLEITSTGGRWMMARKKQRPGEFILPVTLLCNHQPEAKKNKTALMQNPPLVHLH